MQNDTLFSSTKKIFVLGYGFLTFAKNMDKNIARNIRKSLNSNIVKHFLIMLNNLQQMHLKLLQKESLKKQRKPSEI